MYERSAEFYDAIYSWKNYPLEVACLMELLTQRGHSGGTLLDVACGTGLHLSLLQRYFRVAGLERDRRMAALAQARLPNISIFEGDMRTFALDSLYDVVTCLFSSIGYMQTLNELHQALVTMADHVRPGGILVVEPWLQPHEFSEGHLSGDFYDGADMKLARLSRSWTEGQVSVLEMHHMVATRLGVETFVETHRMGLFTEMEMLRTFDSIGLSAQYDREGLMGRGLYLAIKPASP